MISEQPLSYLDADTLMACGQLLILDLREPALFRCGHIPNAINLGQHDRDSLLSNLGKDVPILFYASEVETAQAIAGLFAECGFSKSFYLEASYDEWQSFQQCSAKLSPTLCQWLAHNGYSGCDVNERGFNGETPLMTAAKKGVPAIMIELMDHGADLNAVNNDNNSAVWLSCFSNNVFALMLLIQEGADLNIQNVNGATPLIYAASKGRFAMVQLLLSAGADFNCVTMDGFSALDVAASLKIIKLLRHVEKGNAVTMAPQGIFKQAS